MGIEIEREAEVADVLGGVGCLRHRTQGRGLHEVLLRLALDRVEEAVQLRAGHLAVARDVQVVAHDAQEVRELLDAVGVGLVMHAIERAEVGTAVLGERREVLGDRFVREEHEVLDKEVRRLALLEVDGDGLAGRVELDLDLRRVELDSPSLRSGRADLLREGVQGCELRMHRAGALVEDALRLFVGEALVGVDERLAEPAVGDMRVSIKGEDGRDREAVFVRIQRAEVGREDVREHRDGAVDEVHARRTLARLGVERVAGTHEEGDIGDVDADLVGAVGVRAHGERIVEVLRVGRVDGARWCVAEVFARRARTYLRRFGRDQRAAVSLEPLRLRDDARREGRGEALAERECAHLDVVLAGGADDLLDDAVRVRRVGVPARHADEHLVARRRAVHVAHLDGQVHLLVVGVEVRRAILLDERPDEGRACARDDTGYLAAFARRHPAARVAVRAGRDDRDDVAMERVRGRLGRDEEVVRSLAVAGEEADTLAGHRDRPLEFRGCHMSVL